MAIRFYKNGTTGAQDGEEISNGDLSNPLVFDGMYPAETSMTQKVFRLHVRSDNGEIFKNVVLGIEQPEPPRIFIKAIGERLTGIQLESYYYGRWISKIKLVNEYNVPIEVIAIAWGDETNQPNIEAKIVVAAKGDWTL